MPSVPYIPASAPFTGEQRAWINGYLAGLLTDANASDGNISPAQRQKGEAPAEAEPLVIMYGSQTGTAEQLAKRLAADAGTHGFKARVLEMNAFASVDFSQEQRLVLVTSTWGDGDPPDNAMAFWQHLSSADAAKLDHLNYSVLALGDRNYENFCGAGKKFDERLAQLGAKCIHPRAECDVEYETTAKEWMTSLWPALESTTTPNRDHSAERKIDLRLAIPAVEPLARHERDSSQTEGQLSPASYDRNRPFPARLLVNRRLNAPGSAKDTRHFEISLEGSGLGYEVGDALGVLPTNCPVLIEELLAMLGFKGEEIVKDPSNLDVSLHSALLRNYAMTQPSFQLVQAAAERSNHKELLTLLNPANKLNLENWLYGRDIVDLLRECPGANFTPQEFVGFLRKLQPRLYSISSSPKAHPGCVHLTVANVRYDSHGRAKKGVCSSFLADRVALKETPVPIFVQTSQGFRLPENGETPIIMIGPGTGIAPFRAFLEERRAVGATGKAWLFFGDQRSDFDFLYRDELEAMLAAGTLTRLDTAFSRDQVEKIYVQDRILENGKEVWAWLDAGAHIYVCGDAKRMAKDVDAAIHQVIANQSARAQDAAVEYVSRLKTEKRYQRDVY